MMPRVPCDQCEATFSRPHGLKRHKQQVHDPESQRRYKCPYDGCDKSYARTDSLQSHIDSSHMGIKKEFKCRMCGQCFTHENSLKLHYKSVHFGAKFECDQCEKSYRRQDELVKHKEIVHLGLKRHSCEKCDQKFTTKASLKLHIRWVHDKIKFECQLCDKVCRREFELARHMKNVHKMKAKTVKPLKEEEEETSVVTEESSPTSMTYQPGLAALATLGLLHRLGQMQNAKNEGSESPPPQAGTSLTGTETREFDFVDCSGNSEQKSAQEDSEEIDEKHFCKFCDQTFQREDGLKKHMLHDHVIKSLSTSVQ